MSRLQVYGRRVERIAALFLFFVLFVALNKTRVFAGQETADEEPIVMEVSYGFDQAAKGGRYLPLTVVLKNRQSERLEGELTIKALESDMAIYQYCYQVQAEPRSDVTLTYEIPLGVQANQLFLSLTDKEGNTLLNKRVKLNVSRDVPELLIGILSDEPWELAYFDGVGIRYSTLRTRSFELEESEMPMDEAGLDLLDVLVVNNYKLRNLSELQTAAIMDWVYDGGVLILGTGRRVDDTLGRFAPELLDDSYGTPAERMIDLGEEYIVDQPDGGMILCECVDIPLHGGNVVLSSDGFPLLTAATKERGMIAVAAFDLSDIAQFCMRQPGYVDYLFTELLGENRINQLAELSYSGNSGKFWSVQSLINTGDVDKLPRLKSYILVVTLYLFLLGPGLYLFLKNRELSMYYRGGVVTLALLFAALIYLMGSSTRFRATFYTYARILDATGDYLDDATYVNIQNPYNRPYTVQLNPEYRVLPITRSSLLGERPEPELSGESPYQISIERTGDALLIRGQNIAAFTPRYFRMERKLDNTDRLGIVGEVDYFEGHISGKLKNCFPYPVENTTLLLYGTMIEIGHLEAGESVDLETCRLLRFPLGSSYSVAERVSGENNFDQANIDNREYLQAMERSNLLKFYIDNYMTGYTADARVIAFSTEKEESQFLAQDSAQTYGLTMLTSLIEVNASQDRSLYRSALMKTPRVISGSYDSAINAMNGAEPLVLEYQLGTDIDVESLTFEQISPEFLEGSSTREEIFVGSVYCYNYLTGNYEQISQDGQTMRKAQLAPYLSPGNTLTARYVYDGMGGYHAIRLPMPMVAGRER